MQTQTLTLQSDPQICDLQLHHWDHLAVGGTEAKHQLQVGSEPWTSERRPRVSQLSWLSLRPALTGQRHKRCRALMRSWSESEVWNISCLSSNTEKWFSETLNPNQQIRRSLLKLNLNLRPSQLWPFSKPAELLACVHSSVEVPLWQWWEPLQTHFLETRSWKLDLNLQPLLRASNWSALMMTLKQAALDWSNLCRRRLKWCRRRPL